MKILLTLFLLIGSISVLAKEISISFDDAPMGDSVVMTGNERTSKILKALKDSKVPRAAFYVNTNRLDRSNGNERLRKYFEAGHLIGNHTHSHPNIRKVTKKEYLADFRKADKNLKDLGILTRYFRYPFLRRGKTQEEVVSIHQEIIKSGYTDAFVTVDNYDFYMNHLFKAAVKKKQKINYKNLERFYVETLFQGIEFYAELARKVVKKDVKHVMLLHENDLAALFVGKLIKKLKESGWKIITPEDSYKDPITGKFPKEVFNHGSGRVNALAKRAGFTSKISSGLESERVIKNLFNKYKVIEP